MIKRLQAKRSWEEGFTLIELLIVVILLGVLAAIVVFAVSSSKDDAVGSACKTDVKSVELAANAVLTHASAYPAGPVNSKNAPGSALLASGGAGGLLKSWPSSRDYILQYTVSGPDVVVNVYSKTKFEHIDGQVYDDAAHTSQSAPASCTSV